MNRHRIVLLAAIALAMWGLKHHYASAEAGELTWILWPVAKLVELVSGVRFEFESGAGYLSRERLFLIAKPCAGVNFMIAALGMVGYLLSARAVSWASSACAAMLSLAASYAAAVAANTLRIAGALWLASHPLGVGWWTAARMHRLEGVAVYFAVLVALHMVVLRSTKSVVARGAA